MICWNKQNQLHFSWKCVQVKIIHSNSAFLDCDDGSDEDSCLLVEGKCADDQFKCVTSGVCIPAAWKCDGRIDCDDGSDEPTSGCGAIKCPKDHFKCDNNRCIFNSWLCDGADDCGGGCSSLYTLIGTSLNLRITFRKLKSYINLILKNLFRRQRRVRASRMSQSWTWFNQVSIWASALRQCSRSVHSNSPTVWR